MTFLYKTNRRQFELEVLGARKPSLGEVFEIEVPPYRERIEVQCVFDAYPRVLVELMDDDASVPKDGTRSRVISDLKERPANNKFADRTYYHQTNVETIEALYKMQDEDEAAWDEFHDRTHETFLFGDDDDGNDGVSDRFESNEW